MNIQLNRSFWTYVLKRIVLCLSLILTSQIVAAKESALINSELTENSKEYPINNQKWAKWILSQVQNLPSLQAMDKSTLAASDQ